MKDLTKLADWHQAMADEPKRNQAKREKHAETARILRSAAAGDVQNLIDNYGLAVAKGDRDATIKYRAALESALRLALAAREGFVMVPVEPTPDMLEAGAGTKYEKRARNVWRDMIAAAAPKGTT